MTLLIIIITVAISLACFNNSTLNRKLILNPFVVMQRKEWFRLFTSGFQHADYLHLFINMFVLYSFGQAVEMYYALTFGSAGRFLYILLYLTAIAASNLPSVYKEQHNPAFHSLGASGAVSAVVFTSILFNPYNKIYLYGLIGLPGILLGLVYLAYSWYAGKQKQDNINHDAHFWGAIYGIAFTICFKPKVLLFFFKQLLFMV